MADRPAVKTRGLTRDKLATFLKSHELIKAFEDLSQDVSEVIPDAIAQLSDESESLLSASVFLPRVPQLPPDQVDTIGLILASQIFGG